MQYIAVKGGGTERFVQETLTPIRDASFTFLGSYYSTPEKMPCSQFMEKLKKDPDAYNAIFISFEQRMAILVNGEPWIWFGRVQ